MELNEFVEISILLGYYKNLLSDRQKEYMIKHFEEDYSLSEIAGHFEVSRQAVYDNIKRGIKIIKDYEDKIGSYKRDQLFLRKLKELKKDFNLEKLENIIQELQA